MRFSGRSARAIQVKPEAVGWCLLGLGEPTFFLSGRQAEQAGRILAVAAARNGDDVELRICDRSGRLAGRFVFGGSRGGLSPVVPAGRLHQAPSLAPHAVSGHV